MKWGFVAGLVACPALAVFLAFHNVDTDLTAEDEVYLQKILLTQPRSIPRVPQTFGDQIKTILAVQDAVLRMYSPSGGIPLGHTREPKDLYKNHSEACYDLSRTIEKALIYFHIRVRHVSVYALDGESEIQALLTDGDSHALSEALTTKGWIAIDSLRHWIGLTSDGEPVSVDDLDNPHEWSSLVKDTPNAIFTKPYVSVIGLYSRHGKFYPPFDRIPDVNYTELIQNISD